MGKMVFINLAVKDLEKSKEFFTGLGYTINPDYTDDTAACVVFSDGIYAMLLTESKMSEFTKKSLVDAHTATEAIIALSAESRQEVDDLVEKALSSGGAMAREPEDHGFMYVRSFEDPDGHIWEIAWMDQSQAGEDTE